MKIDLTLKEAETIRLILTSKIREIATYLLLADSIPEMTDLAEKFKEPDDF